METAELEIRKIMDKLNINKMPKWAQIQPKSLRTYLVKIGGLEAFANRAGIQYGDKYNCKICGAEIISPRKRTLCGKKECRRQSQKQNYHKNRSNHKTKNPKIRPFTYSTDILLIADLQKGWPPEKVAKINAEALGRDYNDVLKHIYILLESTRGQTIISNFKEYHTKHYSRSAIC